jgi:hypothetical protein
MNMRKQIQLLEAAAAVVECVMGQICQHGSVCLCMCE